MYLEVLGLLLMLTRTVVPAAVNYTYRRLPWQRYGFYKKSLNYVISVCLQLKQLKSAHTDLEQQLTAVQKQYQLLHKDNEKLLSIVNEQAKYKTSCM